MHCIPLLSRSATPRCPSQPKGEPAHPFQQLSVQGCSAVMSLDEGRALLEMEEQLSTKEDVIARMSTEERQYHEVRFTHTVP